MSNEQNTPELVNEIACNKIILQKHPEYTDFNIRNYEPESKNWYEKGWKYYDPLLVVLYENGRIFYEGQLYHMNEKTRDLVQKKLQEKQKMARLETVGEIVKITVCVGAMVFAVVFLANSISKSAKNKEQQNKEKIQTTKDSVQNNNGALVLDSIQKLNHVRFQNQKTSGLGR